MRIHFCGVSRCNAQLQREKRNHLEAELVRVHFENWIMCLSKPLYYLDSTGDILKKWCNIVIRKRQNLHGAIVLYVQPSKLELGHPGGGDSAPAAAPARRGSGESTGDRRPALEPGEGDAHH